MLKIITGTPEETTHVGEKVGKLLINGDVICLEGPLGAGKTALTHGIAKGLGVKDYINSPTFNIIKEYEGRVPFYHMDLYRLEEADELIDLGYEEYVYGQGVTVIEWADKAADFLPEERLTIKMDYGGEELSRVIEIIPSGIRYEKLVENLRGCGLENVINNSEGD